jgi:hypothetical protein
MDDQHRSRFVPDKIGRVFEEKGRTPRRRLVFGDIELEGG